MTRKNPYTTTHAKLFAKAYAKKFAGLNKKQFTLWLLK